MITPDFIKVEPQGPLVSFDTRLGNKVPEGMVLDFDQTVFGEFCQAAAPDAPDAASQASILITAKGYGKGHLENGTMHVRYGANLEAVNETLRHEACHYFDQMRGEPRHNRQAILGNLGVISTPVTLPVSLGMLIYKLLEPSVPHWTNHASITLGGIILASNVAYYAHPWEVRARAVAKKYSGVDPLILRPATDYGAPIS